MRCTYYHQFDSNENLIWYVYEKATEQIIAEFYFEDDAEELCNFIERSGGFAGHTPSFMLVKVPMKNINDAFAMEFA